MSNLIEIVLAFNVGITLTTLPVGIYFIKQQQKQIKNLEKQLTIEKIENHTRVKLLEDRYDRLFATQNANLEKTQQTLYENNQKALNELELRFKGFKNNFTNNY